MNLFIENIERIEEDHSTTLRFNTHTVADVVGNKNPTIVIRTQDHIYGLRRHEKKCDERLLKALAALKEALNY